MRGVLTMTSFGPLIEPMTSNRVQVGLAAIKLNDLMLTYASPVDRETSFGHLDIHTLPGWCSAQEAETTELIRTIGALSLSSAIRQSVDGVSIRTLQAAVSDELWRTIRVGSDSIVQIGLPDTALLTTMVDLYGAAVLVASIWHSPVRALYLSHLSEISTLGIIDCSAEISKAVVSPLVAKAGSSDVQLSEGESALFQVAEIISREWSDESIQQSIASAYALLNTTNVSEQLIAVEDEPNESSSDTDLPSEQNGDS